MKIYKNPNSYKKKPHYKEREYKKTEYVALKEKSTTQEL